MGNGMMGAVGMVHTNAYDENVVDFMAYLIGSARYDYILSKVEYFEERLKYNELMEKTSDRAKDFLKKLKKQKIHTRKLELAYKSELGILNRLKLIKPRTTEIYVRINEQTEKKNRAKEYYQKDLAELKRMQQSPYRSSKPVTSLELAEIAVKKKEKKVKDNLVFFKTDLFDAALGAFCGGMDRDEYIEQLNKEALSYCKLYIRDRHQFNLWKQRHLRTQLDKEESA